MSNNIVIFTALEEEKKAVFDFLEGAKEVNKSGRVDYVVANYSIDYHIILVCANAKGNTNAGITVTQIIADWNPKYIILTGIAAGIEDGKRQRGDLLIANPIVNYTSGKLTDNRMQYDTKDYPIDKDFFDKFCAFELTKKYLSKFVSKVNEKYHYDPELLRHVPMVHTGYVACVNEVINSKERIDELLEHRYNLIGIEMEGFGLAEAVNSTSDNSKKPIILLIKAISDLGYNKKDDKWRKYAMDVSACVVTEFLKTFGEQFRIQNTDFPFTNRTEEIDVLINRLSTAQYYIVHAPAGYGKTVFINELENRFIEAGWICAVAKIQESDSLQTLITSLTEKFCVDIPKEKFGTEIDYNYLTSILLDYYYSRLDINKIKGIVLLIDSDGKPNLKVIQDFIEIIPQIYSIFSQRKLLGLLKFRIVIAGRYLANEKNVIKAETQTNLIIRRLALSPFNYDVIDNAAYNYLHNNLTEEFIRLFSAHLLHYTGGHPAIVAEKIKEFKTKHLSVDDFFQKNKDIKDKMNELKFNDSYKGTKLSYDIMRKISIFRYLDDKTLNWLVNDIEISKSVNDLASDLLKTYLYTRKDGVIENSITRKIMSIQFINEDMNEFVQQCEKAKIFYLKEIKSSAFNRVRYIREYFFQFFQSNLHCIDLPDGRNNLVTNFYAEIAEIIKSLERIEKEILLEQLESDWEFQFTVNYYLRKDNYNNAPYQKLRKTLWEG